MNPPPPGRYDDLVLGALVAMAAASALTWAGAALAAAASGSGLLPAGLPEAAVALVRLAAHPGDPAQAWTPEAAATLPGPLGYWAAQAGVLVAAAAGGVAGRAALRSLRWSSALGVRPDGGLGRSGDLRALRVRRAPGDRVVLGRLGRSLVAAEAGSSLAVVGPTGCGKTAGLAVPALLEWRGPVIATSVKGDLVEATLAHRAGRGRVWVYDPTGSAGARPEGWSALAACGTWAGAQRVAAWLVEAARPRRDSVTDADYWYGQARRALAPYLHAAALAGEPMATVVRWVESVEEAEVDHLLCELAPDAPREAVGSWALAAPGDGGEALVAARSLWQKEERLRDSILATVENVLAGYADPGVAALDQTGGIDLDEWLEGDNTIYVVAAAHDQARLRPVFSVLVAEAVRRAYDAANACGGTLLDPCLVLLDEAGNIAPAAQLPTWAATARSHGISLITVWQDLAQLRALYGEAAATVLNNHQARLFGSGIADVSTLEYLSRIVGQSAFVEHNRSVDLTGGRRSLSEHTSWRPTVPLDTLRRMRRDEALLVHGADLPVRLRLRPWFAERSLRHRVDGA